MTETEKFLQYLKGTSEIEFNNLDKVLSYKEATGKNIYFCCGLEKKSSNRCNDNDIKTKKYYVVDLDIRLDHYEKTGKTLKQGEMQEKGAEIMELLDNNGYGDYCAVVDSGNGLHFYYAGDERHIDKQTYSSGVKYIFEKIDNIIKETGFKCDPAVSNLARIMRLPGTINPRYKKKKDVVLFDLGDIECSILHFTEKKSDSFSKIEEYAKEYEQEKVQHKEDRQVVNKIVKDYKKSDDIWEEINNISSCDIACEIRGVTASDRGMDNVALKEPDKNMGAYWYRPYNIIVNTGSSLIRTNKAYFTTYELVLNEMMNGDKQATLEYFKDRHGIEVKEKQTKQKQVVEIPKKKFETIGYEYGSDVFRKFDCVMSGELVTVVAPSHSGKTTFAMDMIARNSELGQNCLYINLEFDIETMRKSRWLFLNGKEKRNLTQLDPLSDADREKMELYVKTNLKKFNYHNNPKGMDLNSILELVISKEKEGIKFFVIDTFSKITGNLESEKARTNQNKTMETFQELVQNLGVTVLLLHHTNKNGVFEGSQKIMDLSNVFITIEREEDLSGETITTYKLSKDKFVTFNEIKCKYTDHKLIEIQDQSF